MNITVITLGTLTEKQTDYINLEQKLLDLSTVYKVELEGDTVHIYVGGDFNESTHNEINEVFSDGGFLKHFEYRIHDYEEEFELAEDKLKQLRSQVSERIALFTEDPELGKVESVEVDWTTTASFLRRFLGINVTWKRGIVSVSRRASLYPGNHHTLTALQQEFGLPFRLKDVPPTKKD